MSKKYESKIRNKKEKDVEKPIQLHGGLMTGFAFKSLEGDFKLLIFEYSDFDVGIVFDKLQWNEFENFMGDLK